MQVKSEQIVVSVDIGSLVCILKPATYYLSVLFMEDDVNSWHHSLA
jgi:hypothetical protein